MRTPVAPSLMPSPRARAAAALACLLACGAALALPRTELYPHGPQLDSELPRGDDASSAELNLTTPIVFYGQTYATIYVNNDGLLSFRTDIESFQNVELPLAYPVIAALYSNVDTTGSGNVFYRETRDAYVIAKASETVRQNFAAYQSFEPKTVFVATWSNVGYHQYGADKLNTFQIAVISDGKESFVEFLYPEDGIQWIQGTPTPLGLPDARAQAGFVADDGRYFTLKGSGSYQIRNLVQWSNCKEPGKHLFRVGNIAHDGNIEIPDSVYDNELYEEEPKSCAKVGPNLCHIKGQCVDYPTGVCCRCIDDYYGNGKSCVKNDVPLRVNGKVSGVLNGEKLEDVDLQAYVVMSDGRAYTALSRINSNIGYDTQTLSVLGGVIGWLFARPIDNTKNGYQLTGGVFNHTAEITYPGSSHYVIIRQSYGGHDVFDQLYLETEIRGTTPKIPSGTKLEISEYDEHYSYPKNGLIVSESTRVYKSKDTIDEFVVNIKQTFEFSECLHSPIDNTSNFPVILRVAKNFIGYESREGIVRFGMSNKVTPLGQEDPCLLGKRNCGPQSSCTVEGDSYKCICNPGFQSIYQSDYSASCIDINECISGKHTCDKNAQCYNEEGSYSCQCNQGFEGNGASCEKITGCRTLQCDPNAQCYESPDSPRCYCNEGFTGSGTSCWLISESDCSALNNCSPHATCALSPYTNNFICQCIEGYSGDGYNCTLDEMNLEPTEGADYNPDYAHNLELPECILDFCSCRVGFKLTVDAEGNQICEKTEDNTESPKEVDQEDVSCNVRNNCHRFAVCAYVNNSYECRCTAGFEGDGLDCQPSRKTCDPHSYDACDAHASCRYDDDEQLAFCTCDPGYEGDGIACISVADCHTSEDCEENAECKLNDESGRYECLCESGFSKDSNDACVYGTCGGAKCHEYATCEWDADLEVQYCQCESGYKGDGVNQCLQPVVGCEIVNNCGAYASCEFVTDVEKYECKCNVGYEGDGFECNREATCRENPSLCSPYAACTPNYQAKYVCECLVGFIGNGSVCQPLPKRDGNFLLLNQGNAVLRVPLIPSRYDIGRPIHVSYFQMPIGIDIDCFSGRVYWTDIAGKQIKSTNYDGSNLEIFLSDDINSSEGLSIDWVSRNVFWTDSKKDTIEVANLDNKLRKVLVNRDLADPRGIVAHPSRGKLFWSDWNRKEPKIEWANMDGTERSVFLQGEAVALPNSLAIDWDSDELCYADAGTKKIECVQIDSRASRTIAYNCSYPFGLTITDTHYYWTDWTTKKVEVAEKGSLRRLQPLELPLASGRNNLYGVAAVPERCLQLASACQRAGDCPAGRLCLPTGRAARQCV